ncbi:GDSL-type esterase/lipase family protein [Paenibacillus alvei]|uniref:GDSL-type esterase/lipase family protein n=2 Tax=Paenibacillus alvei TaxID=44250 RepID=A0ABT4H152_PAEAL|nr:GDSL-type esterase/lipase family protein [Paenibacillus alvei]MCY9543928.1 GDSL-type esterase/lipase family protein [Paenibacillus alvei]MCY9705957.1 GDSL-type esterase/lipase family protein [Paenibacillus alvei]MCY9737729.1 GDSL-type esterase/lipase family protein [Paenibacillus alvei]MCY9754729.1 GDSL-type esterase/lipase family protein [Paenibacillus alvei]MCY9762366.1 GDSL-type esterase/lipase family protein [Paenibacillus alvei]
MLNTWKTILLAGMLVISLTACANQNGGTSSMAVDTETSTNKDATTLKEAATSMNENDELKSLFKKSVFFGDSITEGFMFHDVLDIRNVFGEAGKTAFFAVKDNDAAKLVERNPEHLFIALGSDDILWPTDNPLQFAIQQYGLLLDQIKEKLPSTKITILSVTPVTEKALKEEPRYSNIAAYNQMLKELAGKKQVKFVDVSSIAEQNPALYEEDGIHFKAEFYPLLLDFLKGEL